MSAVSGGGPATAAEAELEAVLEDEPAWLPDLRVEPFELVVSE